MKVLLLFTAIALCAAYPQISESFDSVVAVQMNLHDHYQFGQGIYSANQPKGQGVENFAFPQGHIHSLLLLQLYDLRTEFIMVNSTANCSVLAVDGQMPPIWGWLANAVNDRNYSVAGHNMEVWRRREPSGATMTLIIDAANPTTPKILFRNTTDITGGEIDLVLIFTAFKATTPPPTRFAIPTTCKAADLDEAPLDEKGIINAIANAAAEMGYKLEKVESIRDVVAGTTADVAPDGIVDPGRKKQKNVENIDLPKDEEEEKLSSSSSSSSTWSQLADAAADIAVDVIVDGGRKRMAKGKNVGSILDVHQEEQELRSSSSSSSTWSQLADAAADIAVDVIVDGGRKRITRQNNVESIEEELSSSSSSSSTWSQLADAAADIAIDVIVDGGRKRMAKGKNVDSILVAVDAIVNEGQK